MSDCTCSVERRPCPRHNVVLMDGALRRVGDWWRTPDGAIKAVILLDDEPLQKSA